MTKIICNTMKMPTTITGHAHTYAHITIPLTDPLYLKYNGLEFYLSPEQIAFIPPNCFHQYFCNSPVLIFNIPEHMIKKSDLLVLNESAVLPIDDKLFPLITLIKQEVLTNANCDSIRYLFYYLYDKLVDNNTVKSLKYINENFSDNISVAELATVENYNPSYYTDWFKKKIGFLPSEYLQKIRIEKAKELLVNTHYRIIEIAFQVGYHNNSSFTRAFKEVENVSPSKYRTLNIKS